MDLILDDLFKKAAGDLGDGKNFPEQCRAVMERIKIAVGQDPSEPEDWWLIHQKLMKDQGLRPWEIEKLTLIEVLMYLEPCKPTKSELEREYSRRHGIGFRPTPG
ncbi:MAG TPA: hypothetical protein VJ739_02360 [Gemmataceae bacterium]|nr:hypothetical protein [Gemmataceae bacterium]